MKITTKQELVLSNLDRVIPLTAKVRSERPRYQLDGVECTAQISSLVARKLISKNSQGYYRRIPAKTTATSDRVGERQAPPVGTIEAMRAALLAPQLVRPTSAGKGIEPQASEDHER